MVAWIHLNHPFVVHSRWLGCYGAALRIDDFFQPAQYAHAR
jgi:hypothetical protein